MSPWNPYWLRSTPSSEEFSQAPVPLMDGIAHITAPACASRTAEPKMDSSVSCRVRLDTTTLSWPSSGFRFVSWLYSA